VPSPAWTTPTPVGQRSPNPPLSSSLFDQLLEVRLLLVADQMIG
jgi:hypothetical protein